MALGEILVLVGASGVVDAVRRVRRLRRESFIRQYVFSKSLFDALSRRHTELKETDCFLVARALRCFFLIRLRVAPAQVGMPSRVVDDLWHELILDTPAYHSFCARAFGRYFHHVPAARMNDRSEQDSALRRTWRYACLEENIDPKRATRLPLLFAIDRKLSIERGHTWSLERMGETAGDDAGFGCSGGGLADSTADGGCSGGCSGGCGGGD